MLKPLLRTTPLSSTVLGNGASTRPCRAGPRWNASTLSGTSVDSWGCVCFKTSCVRFTSIGEINLHYQPLNSNLRKKSSKHAKFRLYFDAFGHVFTSLFDRHVLKYLLGRKVRFHDLAFFDPVIYESLRQLVLDAENKVKKTDGESNILHNLYFQCVHFSIKPCYVHNCWSSL